MRNCFLNCITMELVAGGGGGGVVGGYSSVDKISF